VSAGFTTAAQPNAGFASCYTGITVRDRLNKVRDHSFSLSTGTPYVSKGILHDQANAWGDQ
jgi:hypothetical protein